jgi:AAA family ATP:ADP antiporter
MLLALNGLLVLTAYSIIKPVRDSLILAEQSAQIKSYLNVATVLVLAAIVPLYGRLTDRLPRRDGSLGCARLESSFTIPREHASSQAR